MTFKKLVTLIGTVLTNTPDILLAVCAIMMVMKGLNTRQRLVLFNALKGMNQTQAYEAVYGHSSATYRCASELFNKPHFKAELDRYLNGQLQTIEAQVLSKTEKRQILANFARAQLVDLIDENGVPRIDKKSPAAKALKEWCRTEQVDRNGNPIVKRSLKMLDPIAAIMEDNKMMGDYAPSKHLVAQKVQFDIRLVERDKRVEDTENV